MTRYFAHPFGPNWTKSVANTYSNHGIASLDISCAIAEETCLGWPVYSLTNGVVHLAGTSETAGNYVIIRTRDMGWTDWTDKDLYIYYMHFQEVPLVKTGDSVIAGQQIGKAGDTGKSYGSHLHIDIRQNGEWGKDNSTIPLVEKKMCSKYDEYINNSRVINWSNEDSITNKANCYNYFIFANDPVFIGGSGSISIIPNTKLEEYYSTIIPDDFFVGGGYGFEEQKKRLARLCQREVGPSQSGTEESLSGMVLYSKLIRMRAIYGNGNISSGGNLMEVFAGNGFSGWSAEQMPLASSLPEGVSMDNFIELCYQNFTRPDCIGLLPYHAAIASYGPYFNFGYSVVDYANTITNEKAIADGIVNSTLPSHLITNGNKPYYGDSQHNNSHFFIGMVGNTGYFGNNNCYSQKFSAQPIVTRDLF